MLTHKFIVICKLLFVYFTTIISVDGGLVVLAKFYFYFHFLIRILHSNVIFAAHEI